MGLNCCEPKGCCGCIPTGQEPPTSHGAHQHRHSAHQHCTLPSSSSSHSIATASSTTAKDSDSQRVSLDWPEPCYLPERLPSDTHLHPRSLARRLLTCWHRHPGHTKSDLSDPSRPHSQVHRSAPHRGCAHAARGMAHPLHAHSSASSSTCCAASYFEEDNWLNGSDEKPYAVFRDIERGSAMLERVTLIVRGLKCGCCESGLSTALQKVPAIKNYKVNIVLARIEFNLDTGELSVAEVISRLHRDTGYTFELLGQPDGQILELVATDPSEIYRAGRPFGVAVIESKDKQVWNPSMLWSGRSSTIPPEMTRIDRNPSGTPSSPEKRAPVSLFAHTVRIHYDAKQIGARDVLEYYQQLAPSQNLQLAPAAGDTGLVGSQQTKRACIMFLVTLLFTIPVLLFSWSPFHRERLQFAHASLALATIVQAIAIREFVPSAFQSLIHSRLFEMDFLIAMSTTIAYLFSVVSYVFLIKHKPLESGSFFETSTLLVTLILLGRAVNEFARFRAAKSVSIRSLQTHDALLVISGGPPGPAAVTRKIDARLLQYGDYFKILPHTRIVTDGRVVYGGSEVDESMVTGETLPVAKGLDHMVHAGTMNGSGPLIAELTELPHENSISRIAAMVENAELSKPKVQALADKIAGYFVPAIATIGVVVFLIWLFVDRSLNRRPWPNAVVKALTYSIATLVVSCPCAIGLAVPMVVLIAGGCAARFGIIFRDPQKLEIARNTTDIVFDKTGTLTKGDLTVVDADFHGAQRRHVKSMILRLLEGDKHPVAVAVCIWLDEDRHLADIESLAPIKMVDIVSEPGNGVRGVCEESQLEVRAGNPQWLGVSVLESQHTVFCVTVSGVLSATFRLADRARDQVDGLIGLLQKRNLKVHMISGDGEGAVSEIAHTLNIPKHQTRWRHKPVDKQRYIHELQKEGKVVLFCGDGTNDSIALKQADVGVHINHGSDAAKSASDVVLMTTRLHDILILLDISKAAYRRIILNFSWSAIYNLVAILMASGAFVKIRIAPAYAGFGELVSVLPVVLIAFQMKWRNYGWRYKGFGCGCL